ncbi:hypothetical protein D3C77_772410 [compost metagenome]
MANEERTKSELITLLKRGIASGQIDAGLQPDIAATWLIILAEGAIGRAVMTGDFDSQSHIVMLKRLVRCFLQPQSTQ